MTDYTPRRDIPKLELHLEARCNLSCSACSRASFLAKHPMERLTLADVTEVFRQVDELRPRWTPRVIIIGGEPTLHPQFLEICKMSVEWSRCHRPDNFVQVFSNGTTERTRALLERARLEHNCSIPKDEWKTESITGENAGSIKWRMDTYVSPTDAGLTFEDHGVCYQASSQICGVGVYHEGYTLCPPAGPLSALLGLPEGLVMTKRIADLFDPVWAERATRIACEACGYAMDQRGKTEAIREGFARYVAEQPLGQAGTPMSPTWVRAFGGRK